MEISIKIYPGCSVGNTRFAITDSRIRGPDLTIVSAHKDDQQENRASP